MSKFFNALAVAVLGMALLMGAASADTAEVNVDGCLLASDYIDIIDTALTAGHFGLINSAASPVTATGGTLGVEAANTYDLTVNEKAVGGVYDGKMYNTAKSHAMAAVLGVSNDNGANYDALKDNTGGPTSLEANHASTVDDCTADSYTIKYQQAVAAADDANPGSYSITLVYTASLTS